MATSKVDLPRVCRDFGGAGLQQVQGPLHQAAVGNKRLFAMNSSGDRRETSYLFWLADANGTTKLTLYELL